MITLFIDIGGVFLTNGWDRNMRAEAVEQFKLDKEEFDSRHALVFDTYEVGKMSLDDYLRWTVFYKERFFSLNEFKAFMFSCSKPYPEMIDWIKTLKQEYSLKIVAVNNEGRELMEYRICQFKLYEWIDIFCSSGFVGLRKPDKSIYQLALDLAFSRSERAIYIDDRPLLVEVGQSLGMKGIHHINLDSTKQQVQSRMRSLFN